LELQLRPSKIGQQSGVASFFDIWRKESQWPSVTKITSFKKRGQQSAKKNKTYHQGITDEKNKTTQDGTQNTEEQPNAG
jgi:hypothetical protein